LLVSSENEEVDIAMDLGIGKRFELIWVRVIPYGVVRIHPFGFVDQHTWSAVARHVSTANERNATSDGSIPVPD